MCVSDYNLVNKKDKNKYIKKPTTRNYRFNLRRIDSGDTEIKITNRGLRMILPIGRQIPYYKIMIITTNLGDTGLEPVASCTSSKRSSQLS